jgi:hypothetical protein
VRLAISLSVSPSATQRDESTSARGLRAAARFPRPQRHGFFWSFWHGSAAVEACWSSCKTLRVAVAMPECFSVLDCFPEAAGWCCFLVEILCFPSRQKAALQPERWPAAV